MPTRWLWPRFFTISPKTFRRSRIKAGVVSGKGLDEEQFKALASLPGRDVLLAQLLYVLQAPMRNLLGVLQAPARDLILVLKAALDKKTKKTEAS